MDESKAIAAGRGKWSPDSDIPHSDWTFIKMRDLGKGPTKHKPCEMLCGARIRFAHLMHHPKTRLMLEVGCVCAGHMEGDPEASAAKERQQRFEAVARRVDKRAKIRIKEQEAFATLKLDTDNYQHLTGVVIPKLDRLLREARYRADEAEKDDLVLRSEISFEEVEEHTLFQIALMKAWESTQARLPDLLSERNKQELFDELRGELTWRRTRKGYRFVTSQRDIIQIFRQNEEEPWGGFYKLAGAVEPVYSRRPLGFDLSKAKSIVINALGNALRSAGRLPSKKPKPLLDGRNAA